MQDCNKPEGIYNNVLNTHEVQMKIDICNSHGKFLWYISCKGKERVHKRQESMDDQRQQHSSNTQQQQRAAKLYNQNIDA